jgi:hypothetical protein
MKINLNKLHNSMNLRDNNENRKSEKFVLIFLLVLSAKMCDGNFIKTALGLQ